MSPPVLVRVAHGFSAPAERVFDAWITPALASRFLFASRTGNVVQCDIRAEPGGGFVVTDRRPVADGDESVFDVVHSGHYVSLDRPGLLIFDFSVASHAGPATRVVVQIQPLGPHASELTLTHDLGAGEDARTFEEATRAGWAAMLARMERELFPKRV